jgi:hypothetical protein
VLFYSSSQSQGIPPVNVIIVYIVITVKTVQLNGHAISGIQRLANRPIFILIWFCFYSFHTFRGVLNCRYLLHQWHRGSQSHNVRPLRD